MTTTQGPTIYPNQGDYLHIPHQNKSRCYAETPRSYWLLIGREDEGTIYKCFCPPSVLHSAPFMRLPQAPLSIPHDIFNTNGQLPPLFLYVTVRNPLLLCPLVLAQDGTTRSRQKYLYRDFSATVLNFTTEMHQSVGNGMREFCDISKSTIIIVDANDLTSRETRC